MLSHRDMTWKACRVLQGWDFHPACAYWKIRALVFFQLSFKSSSAQERKCFSSSWEALPLPRHLMRPLWSNRKTYLEKFKIMLSYLTWH